MRRTLLLYGLSLLVLAACELKPKNIGGGNKSQLQIISKNIANKISTTSDDSRAYIGVKELVCDAETLNYQIDEPFQGQKFNDVIYLSAFPNGNVAALTKEGQVICFDSKGKELKRFAPQVAGKVSSITTDENNLLYVFSNDEKKEFHKVRGRSVERTVSLGVDCTIYDEKGNQQKQLKLDTLKSAFGARIKGDKLVVSDSKTKSVAIFHKESGKTIALIKGMRQCGGVLDINLSNHGELLIANLGSFRVELFDLEGKRLGDFGQRGKEIENFHGCCNPVTLTNLSNGAVVTVEKFPTRIKIYSKNGVKELPVAEELKGCKYMPFTSDNSNNLYVGAAAKGIVKYKVVK